MGVLRPGRLESEQQTTVNFGVRYELFSPIGEKFGRQANFDFDKMTLFIPKGKDQDAALPPNFARDFSFVKVSRGEVDQYLIPWDKNIGGPTNYSDDTSVGSFWFDAAPVASTFANLLSGHYYYRVTGDSLGLSGGSYVLTSSISPIPSPAPARQAATVAWAASTMALSQFNSGHPGVRPNPGENCTSLPSLAGMMLVFSARKPWLRMSSQWRARSS